jgi:hypothetical protein
MGDGEEGESAAARYRALRERAKSRKNGRSSVAKKIEVKKVDAPLLSTNQGKALEGLIKARAVILGSIEAEGVRVTFEQWMENWVGDEAEEEFDDFAVEAEPAAAAEADEEEEDEMLAGLAEAISEPSSGQNSAQNSVDGGIPKKKRSDAVDVDDAGNENAPADPSWGESDDLATLQRDLIKMQRHVHTLEGVAKANFMQKINETDEKLDFVSRAVRTATMAKNKRSEAVDLQDDMHQLGQTLSELQKEMMVLGPGKPASVLCFLLTNPVRCRERCNQPENRCCGGRFR